MIPTRYKDKLPRDWAYPIGAQALTEGLTGAPHVEALTVTFRGKRCCRRSQYSLDFPDKAPYTVLCAEYRPERKPGYGGSHYLAENGFFDETWKLTVSPVPVELRHAVNMLLREKGLLLVVHWLRSSEQTGWMSREHTITLQFVPEEPTFNVYEDSGVSP
jgi:hypothetical protein